MLGHEETFAKVNAPVDIGIKDVVEALALFPRLCSGASCEGKKNVPWGFVWFRYGLDAEEAVAFTQKLYAALVEGVGGSNVVIEMTPGADNIRVELRLHQEAFADAANTIRKLAAENATRG